MFTRRYKKYFALMAVLLVLGPCVAEAPRILAGWYSPDSMEDDDMQEFSETYDQALKMAESNVDLLDYENESIYDASEAAGKMEADFWWLFPDQIRWGFPFRICILMLLLSVAMHLYPDILGKYGKSEENHLSERFNLLLLISIIGFSYSVLVPASGNYYFTFTVFLIILISTSEEPSKTKQLLAASLAATAFWMLSRSTEPFLLAGQEEYLLYDYIVRARISTPVYFFLSFLAESLLFVVPFFFLSRFGIKGGFSTLTTD